MTGSMDQDGAGLGMQRQLSYFCFRLYKRYKLMPIAPGGFCYKACVTVTYDITKYISNNLRGMLVPGCCVTFTHHHTRTKMNHLL